MGFPWWLSSKEYACNTRDTGLIPRLGRIPREGNVFTHPLQYSCLGNPMDKWDWWAMVYGVVRVGHALATLATTKRHFKINKWKAIPCSCIQRLNIIKIPILPKLIYKFISFSNKILEGFFMKLLMTPNLHEKVKGPK